LCPTAPALHSRWLLLLKIEISSIVHCCFIERKVMAIAHMA
jgi:hypothetical protein